MADRHNIQTLLNGDFFRSQRVRELYPILVLIVFLVFIYILMGYQAVKQQHRLTDAKNEMLDAKYHYITIHAQLTEQTRQSKVIATLKEKGSTLQENTIPPTKITD